MRLHVGPAFVLVIQMPRRNWHSHRKNGGYVSPGCWARISIAGPRIRSGRPVPVPAAPWNRCMLTLRYSAKRVGYGPSPGSRNDRVARNRKASRPVPDIRPASAADVFVKAKGIPCTSAGSSGHGREWCRTPSHKSSSDARHMRAAAGTARRVGRPPRMEPARPAVAAVRPPPSFFFQWTSTTGSVGNST